MWPGASTRWSGSLADSLAVVTQSPRPADRAGPARWPRRRRHRLWSARLGRSGLGQAAPLVGATRGAFLGAVRLGLYSGDRWLAALTSPGHRFGLEVDVSAGKRGVPPCRRTSPRTIPIRARARRSGPRPSAGSWPATRAWPAR